MMRIASILLLVFVLHDVYRYFETGCLVARYGNFCGNSGMVVSLLLLSFAIGMVYVSFKKKRPTDCSSRDVI